MFSNNPRTIIKSILIVKSVLNSELSFQLNSWYLANKYNSRANFNETINTFLYCVKFIYIIAYSTFNYNKSEYRV